MPIPFIFSALSGIAIGFLYALLFKKQTWHLLESFLNGQQKMGKAKAITQHILFLFSRFFVIVGLVVALKFTGLIDLQICCIFVVCGFLVSLFVHTKRML